MFVKLGAIFDRVLGFVANISCALIVVAFLTINVDVFMRFFLNRALRWSVDVTEYMLVDITFLGAAWVLRRERHVSLDTAINLLGTRNRAAVNAFTSLLGAVLSLIIIGFGIVSTWDNFQRGTIMSERGIRLPFAPFVMVIPIGFLLLFVQFIRRSFANLRAWQLQPQAEQPDQSKKQLIKTEEF